MVCPCNFNGFPTYGNCRALLLFHIRSGSYGNTKLDGVDFILAQSWPKAIHEGNGTVLLLITKKQMKNKEGQLYRSFLERQRGIVLHYLQVRLAVFLNHNLLISMLR
jgi:hypothetical protein